MRRILFWCLAGITLLVAEPTMAAITCTSMTSPGFSAAFTGVVPPVNATQSTVTVTCNRNAAGDATTLNYQITVDNGNNPAGGGKNRAAFGANLLLYDTYRDAACSAIWKGGGNRIADTITFGNDFLAVSKTSNWWGCIITSQTLPAGTYTDMVTMSLNVSGLTNTFPVSIYTPATCTISTAPSTLSFSYTALGSAKTASSLFRTTCTSLLAYSMSLSATVAVAAGLNYTLAINTSMSGGSSPLAATGTGVAQTFYINGAMAGGQAGTCAGGTCNASNTHTLTITY